MSKFMDALYNTEKDMIESLIVNFFYIDYGFISKVNTDGTVNVTHAIRPMTSDGTSLNELITENIELLTLSTQELSINMTVNEGDKVLIVGLKNRVSSVADVTQSAEMESRLHYARETLKAIPLCVFNSDSKVKISADDGDFKVLGDKLELDGNDYGGLIICSKLVEQLDIVTKRIDAVYNALKNSATGSQDGGALYKSNITAALALITDKEDYSDIQSDTVLHGKGE